MFILQKDNQTFYGPNQWNPKLIKSYIEDDFEIQMPVPQLAPLSGTDIGNGIFAYKVVETVIPDHNPKIQKLHGPFYTISLDQAIQTFEIVDKQLAEVKSELLTKLAANRWKREISGTTATIQGVNLKLTTQRGERDIYLQAVQNNLNGQSWKLVNSNNETVWLTLSTQDLQTIVTSIISHIQTVFDWEKTVADSINAATTLAALDLIDIGDAAVVRA